MAEHENQVTKGFVAAALPTPTDCCSDCDCTDELVVIDSGGSGVVVAYVDAPAVMPLGTNLWINVANLADVKQWCRDPDTGASIMQIA